MKQPPSRARLASEHQLRLSGGNPWGPWRERPDALSRPDCPANLVRFVANGTYSVQVYSKPAWDGVLNLMVRRHDEQPIRSWADMQRIKNELVGPDRIAVEIYPRAQDLVDDANIYHLWVLPAGALLPFGLHHDASDDGP